MTETITDETARTMRALWFQFLDSVEPARPKLHAYCLRLTGSIFDAEDLAQETLLRAFGAMGRGDLHGAGGPYRNAQAYLSRTATNLWIDGLRRSRVGGGAAAVEPREESRETSTLTPAAGAALFERAAPQERAAVVLKDVFDFSLEEIAVILCTSIGAVKDALHRGRDKLGEAHHARPSPRGKAASPELIDRFIAAFNARDLGAMTALLLESVEYEARGVGGERGRPAIWITVNMDRPESVAWERHELDGEQVAVGVHLGRSGKRLLGVSRFEEADGLISRHVGYFFCPETLAAIAERLGMLPSDHGYHQDPDTLTRMIADTTLPWSG